MSKGLNENNIVITVQEFVFYIYFAVMFGARAIGLYEGLLIYKVSIVVGMVFFGIKIVITKHSVLEYIIILSLISEAVLVYYYSGEKGILFYYTLMLGMKGISRQRLERFACLILGISFFLLTFSNSLLLVKDISFAQKRFPFGEILRHSLGYPFPNTCMTTYIILLILIMSVIKKQTKKLTICLSIFGGFFGVILFIYSSSNTGIIVTMFFLLTNYYFSSKRKMSKVDHFLIKATYPLCLFIAIPLPLITLMSERISSLLHGFSHTRWGLSQYYLTNEKISLFGRHFKEMFDGNYAYMIDSSFLYSFLQVGVITFFIVTVLHIGMIKYHVESENRTEISVILSLCLLGLSDPFLFNISYKNIMFIYIGEWIWMLLLKYQKPCDWNCEMQFVKINGFKITVYQCKEIINIVQMMKDKCMQLLAIYFSVFFVIMFSLCLFSWKSSVIGILDEITEWEYFRFNMALSHWGGVFIVCIAVVLLFSIDKNKVEKYTKIY